MLEPRSTVENFQFWVPIEKAEAVKDKSGNAVRRIRGVASTPDEDLQGEIIHQTGLDFAYFLKHGYLNNDHKPGFVNKVGEPTVARINNNQFYIEGFLYNNHPVADEIWKLMQAQESTQEARRKVGFSVQGKVKRRMGKQIMNCWVQDVAITAAPINTKTWAEIVKSLNDEEWLEECDIDRALSAGYATSNQTGGAALRTESLGPRLTNLSYEFSTPRKKKKLRKSFSYDEAIWFVQLQTGFSRASSRLIVDIHNSGIL
ncbi:MAG: hypothetical protein V1897_03140 [Pseudomonadota bacterium]